MAGGASVEQRSCVRDTSEAFSCLAATGEAKLYTPWLRLLFAAIMGGTIVGLYAHCATVGTGLMVTWLDPDTYEPSSYGYAMLVFAIIFTGAFAGIIATGSDLFTTDIAYTTTYLMTYPRAARNGATVARIFRLFVTSYLGNAFGCALIGGLAFGLGSDKYHYNDLDEMWDPSLGDDYNMHASHYYKLLCAMADSKAGSTHPIWANFVNAIGCNFFVTMAIWKSKYSHDAWGQYVSTSLPVIAFCVGGFQHCIANMYTLFAAVFNDCPGMDLSTILVRNLIPVTLGNIVSGCLVAFCGFGMYTRDHAHEDVPRGQRSEPVFSSKVEHYSGTRDMSPSNSSE